jgi:tRNA (guanine-N7-)-methyltransferase
MTESVAETNRLKRRRYRQHGNPFTIRAPENMPDWDEIYGRKAPFALDIGFGEGGFTTELARNHPEWNVLGLEIRPPFVKWLIEARHEHRLNNLYGIVANANEHLPNLLENGSVEFVSINFPDPWFKTRHRKRRVVRPDWLEALLPKLKIGAQIHAMTDFQPIGRQIMSVLSSCPKLRNDSGAERYAEKSTTNIYSEREIIHSKRNEHIFRMSFTYVA